MDFTLTEESLSFTLASAEALSFGLSVVSDIEFELIDERLTFTLSEADALSFDLSEADDIELTLSTPSQIGVENYDGPYEVTPTQSEQVLNMRNLRATQNVIINAIPNNYGLITWDGAKLKVS